MPAAEIRLHAWRPRARAAAAALQLLAFLNVLFMAPALLLSEPPLGLVVKRLFMFSALPALAFLVLRALASAAARVEEGRLSLRFEASGDRVELPLASLAGMRRLRLPLPAPGFRLLLRDGAFPYVVTLQDPSSLAAQLDPQADFRDTRIPLRFLHHPALKFGLGGGVVIFVLFRLHQVITYGGLFGEWQQLGLAHWLQTLLGVALYVLARLLAWAACLRAAVELLALWRNRAWRIALEGAAAAAFYGIAAAVLIARLVLG